MMETLVLKGSPTKIAKASDKVRKGAGEKVTPDSPDEAVTYIMGKINREACIFSREGDYNGDMNINLEEYKGVYVFAQQVDNELSGIAFELLGEAGRLAKPLNTEVTAVSDLGS
ncbi:MAG: hypothetical protein ACLRR3_03755 [Eubacterium sp.]